MTDRVSAQDEQPEVHDVEWTSAQVAMTGQQEVDGVLRSLGDLDGRPVKEHVAVFESAHETLRGALAGAGDRPDGASTG